MHCPFCCHDDTQVVDSRVSEDNAAIRRRRRCPACDKRFTTYERVERALPIVIKSDGTRVEFDRSKMLSSMLLALRKRPVAAEKIDEVAARIEYQLLASGEREVRSKWFGELVMEELRKLDEIAYVRFASVYRRFEDVSEFKNLINEFDQSLASIARS
ncbi:transcriptional regulator NrdR [Candidatus Vallotia tarda]|uniref:Transcriptional repressor NrdR n=1 Tax=Candidatus Vallotiella hemipterorum TaxID=1177213 RepID=A0A916JTD0_9BURK|nr:transcriptional regulator NrdR [Candidatus Vallotia tarda]CAG7601441.1 Transcriptional repressor NrdR [Candidatus Vallotia tarda]